MTVIELPLSFSWSQVLLPRSWELFYIFERRILIPFFWLPGMIPFFDSCEFWTIFLTARFDIYRGHFEILKILSILCARMKMNSILYNLFSRIYVFETYSLFFYFSSFHVRKRMGLCSRSSWRYNEMCQFQRTRTLQRKHQTKIFKHPYVDI